MGKISFPVCQDPIGYSSKVHKLSYVG